MICAICYRGKPMFYSKSEDKAKQIVKMLTDKKKLHKQATMEYMKVYNGDYIENDTVILRIERANYVYDKILESCPEIARIIEKTYGINMDHSDAHVSYYVLPNIDLLNFQ